MAQKFMKKKSKMVTAKKRYKIEKKVRQHNKKMKKAAKKNPRKGKKMRKDPGVPNSLPFKDEILREAEARKKRAEELRQKQKDDRHNLLMEKRGLEKLEKEGLEKLEKEAAAKTEEFEAKSKPENEDDTNKEKGQNGKNYYREFKKVIEAADVILEVLDARDPLGSRCPQVEEAVIKAGSKKKLVLILNKIDLVPKENVVNWLKHLRNELPTVAFKSSTQTQNSNLARSSVPVTSNVNKLTKTTYCLGADVLMKLLGNYCRNKDIRTQIKVGVVGFPNVGKSSLINSLKRNKVCNVGATPGVTKSMQEIHLDKHVILLDCPGIVLAKSDTVSSVLRNAVKVETLDDPIAPVEEILKRCNRNDLLLFYSIPQFNSVAEFLSLMARKQGKLKKGGVPNVDQAARTIINNWNEGKIKYYTHPPENSSRPSYLDAQIVSEMSAEFDIDKLLSDENEEVIGSLRMHTNTNFITNETSGPVEASDEVVELEEEEPQPVMERMEENKKSDEPGKRTKDDDVPQKMQAKAQKLQRAMSLDGNLKLNKSSKEQFKKMKKKRRRNDKVATNLSESLTNALKNLGGGDDNYNFSVDFK